jgi:hypothetical protein
MREKELFGKGASAKMFHSDIENDCFLVGAFFKLTVSWGKGVYTYKRQGGTSMKRLYDETVKQRPVQQGLFSCYQQLSEHEILSLQELFLTNGVHRVVSYDLFTGRTLIEIFLQAMEPHYHEKACLTSHTPMLDASVTDLYTLLQLYVGSSKDDLTEYLEEFFTEQFYLDFIWIEETTYLRSLPWYPLFLETMLALKLDHQLPIIIFSYTEEAG